MIIVNGYFSKTFKKVVSVKGPVPIFLHSSVISEKLHNKTVREMLNEGGRGRDRLFTQRMKEREKEKDILSGK